MPRNSTVSPRPIDGSQPSVTENTMIIIMPNQKVGRLKPMMEPAMIERAGALSGFKPAAMPSGIPMTTEMMKAASVSSMVAGRRSAMTSMTGRRETKELPKSPTAMRARYLRYCSWMGSFSPRLSRASSISTSVAFSCARSAMGSPILKTPTKLTRVRTRMTPTA